MLKLKMLKLKGFIFFTHIFIILNGKKTKIEYSFTQNSNIQATLDIAIATKNRTKNFFQVIENLNNMEGSYSYNILVHDSNP